MTAQLRFVHTDVPDVVLVEPAVYADPRGFFFESYHADKYREHGITDVFVQDNHSRSIRGTLRGLHAQRERPQAKLVRALVGAIFDVAVDLRRDSPTFGRWVGTTLSAENKVQCYIPRGFLHGFCVLSAEAEVEYKCSAPYAPGDELGVVWNDPDLCIAWPVTAPLLSAKDAALPRLADVLDRLPR